MRFTLITPCAKCPFRTDVEPYLRAARAAEIVKAVCHDNLTFACHKSTAFDDDGENVASMDELHCAGALILLRHTGDANGMIQIAERFGIYDPSGLKMDAPVYRTAAAMVAAYREFGF